MADAEHRRTRRALLISADAYTDPALRQLRSPAQDVRRLREVLEDPAIGAFTVDALNNRPAYEVTAAIEDLFADASHGDVLLLYFSCHGYKDDAGRLYFCTTGTRLDRPGSTAIPASYVHEQLGCSRSRNVVLLLDCCYSGAFPRNMVHRAGGSVDVADRLGGSGSAVLCSSTSLEYSFEMDVDRTPADRPASSQPMPSTFTSAIIDGLRTGEADLDGDGDVSVDELYDYAYERITDQTPHQTPTKFVDVRGELVVAVSPRGPRPKPLPEEIAQASENPLRTVRQSVVEDLRVLALKEIRTVGPGGGPAFERLIAMMDDDSRTVASRARDAVDDLRRRGADQGRAASFHPPTADRPADRPPRRRPPPSWPLLPLRPARPPERGGDLAAVYLMPFFTSLLLIKARRREVRFHAWHCAEIDLYSLYYFIVGAVGSGIYSVVRYGDEPVPDDDIVWNVYAGGVFAIPVLLRIYCMILLALRKRPRLPVLGAAAERRADRRRGGG